MYDLLYYLGICLWVNLVKLHIKVIITKLIYSLKFLFSVTTNVVQFLTNFMVVKHLNLAQDSQKFYCKKKNKFKTSVNVMVGPTIFAKNNVGLYMKVYLKVFEKIIQITKARHLKQSLV